MKSPQKMNSSPTDRGELALIGTVGPFLLEHPILRTAVTVGVAGTAFTVSSVREVGQEFLPLLDSGQLLVQLAFYGSLALILLALLRALAGMIAYADVFWLQLLQCIFITFDKVRKRPTYRTFRYFSRTQLQRSMQSRRLAPALAAGMLVILGIGWAQSISRNWEAISALRGANSVLTPTIITVVAGIAVLLAVRTRGRRVRTSAWLLAFALLQYGVLGLSLDAGRMWVDYLRKHAPRATLVFADGRPSETVSIALPASSGLIGFIGSNAQAQFVPDHEIKQISGRSGTVEPQNADLSQFPTRAK